MSIELCDVCHEPASEREGELVTVTGTAPSGIGPEVLRVHEKCRQYVMKDE